MEDIKKAVADRIGAERDWIEKSVAHKYKSKKPDGKGGFTYVYDEEKDEYSRFADIPEEHRKRAEIEKERTKKLLEKEMAYSPDLRSQKTIDMHQTHLAHLDKILGARKKKADSPYHESYTSAINAALARAKGAGYEYDQEETATKIGAGPRKPGDGQTNKFTIRCSRTARNRGRRSTSRYTGWETNTSSTPT